MIRIAIVGCGKITTDYHLPAALVSPLVEVHTLVDTNVTNAEALRHKYAADCAVSQDLSKALSDVDGVLIATPNRTHFELAKMALNAGVSVLIEKPMTTRYADALALCELAKTTGSLISVGYKTRYYPSVILMKQLLQDGFLGAIHSFHYEYGSRGGWSPVSGYNIDPEMSGGGVVINGGTHFLEKMLHWFGEPSSVIYRDDGYGGVEANAKADFHFHNDLGDFSGSFFVSKTVALRNKLFIESERYSCELSETQTETITLYPKDNPDLRMELANRSSGEPANLPSYHYFQKQLEEFAEAVLHDRKVSVDGWTAAQSVKLIEDMYQNRQQLEEPWRDYAKASREHTENG